jgi:hypothetical protein
MAGFSKDEEFVKQFIDLSARKDGFVDRLLFPVPSPRLLLNREVDAWAHKLINYPISDLTEVYMYQEIWEFHTDVSRDNVYTLSSPAYREYELFADEITTQLNCQINNTTSSSQDVSSKDSRTVLRSEFMDKYDQPIKFM